MNTKEKRSKEEKQASTHVDLVRQNHAGRKRWSLLRRLQLNCRKQMHGSSSDGTERSVFPFKATNAAEKCSRMNRKHMNRVAAPASNNGNAWSIRNTARVSAVRASCVGALALVRSWNWIRRQQEQRRRWGTATVAYRGKSRKPTCEPNSTANTEQHTNTKVTIF